MEKLTKYYINDFEINYFQNAGKTKISYLHGKSKDLKKLSNVELDYLFETVLKMDKDNYFKFGYQVERILKNEFFNREYIKNGFQI